ncbi:CDP-alcohol phosphatidyltransferase family protein [Chloroflexota bacterium]
MVKLAKIRNSTAHYLSQPAAKLLAKTPVTPDSLTWFGFLLSLLAGVLIITGNLFVAGFVVLIAGFFDMLDGALARLINRTTRFGAVLDSTLDRIAEAVILLSLLVLYAQEQSVLGSLLVGITLLGSFLVSYVRARAEALGIECKAGLFTRPERVIILALGLLLSRIDYALIITLAVIAALSFFTAIQRLIYAWQRTRAE